MKNLYSIHILTTHKNKDRHINILDSWLKDKENYFFYTDFLTEVGNQVSVCSDDSYYSAGRKNLNELHRIYNLKLHTSTSWIFFCDDDTLPNLSKLERLLPTLDEEKCYGSILDGTWSMDKSLKYLSGGAGYLIPSKLLNKYGPPSLDYLNHSYYSDVCIGLWLRDNLINFCNLKEFHTQPPSAYNYEESDIKNSITFHYIKNKNEIDKILNIWKNEH